MYLRMMNDSDRYNQIIEWWHCRNVTDKKSFCNALDNFQCVFAKENCAIEGTELTYSNVRSIFADGTVKNYSGSISNLLEIKNQVRAFNFLAESFENRVPISPEFILQLHKILLRDCYSEELYAKGERPGTFKVGDYCVGTREVGAAPEDVTHELQELCDEINDFDMHDSLIVAAYFHAVFESIHPFADGNGRVGRTLMNYLLIMNGYPPIVIYEANKETYYMGLEVYNYTEKLDGMLKFLREQMVKTWDLKVPKIGVFRTADGAETAAALAWCRENAPDAFKDMDDAELWENMKELYNRFAKR